MNTSRSASSALGHKNTFVYAVVSVFFAASLLLAMMPTPARAASLNETQIQSILNLLKSFNADQAIVANTEMSLRGMAPSNHGTSTMPKKDDHDSSMGQLGGMMAKCEMVRNLSRGDQDDSVSTLQGFLASQGFFNGSTTKFFGEKTEQALKAWQTSQGIATSGTPGTTGWGALGPKTRSIVARLCNPSSHDDKSISHATSSPNGSNAPMPTCVLTANKSTVQNGESVTLSWISTNATRASSASGAPAAPQGSVTVTPTQTTIYHKSVYGPGGTAGCEAVVNVTGSTATSSVQAMAQPNLMLASVATFNFVQDYSDSFNQNMAAVASAAIGFPFQLAVDSLADIFVQLGVGQ